MLKFCIRIVTMSFFLTLIMQSNAITEEVLPDWVQNLIKRGEHISIDLYKYAGGDVYYKITQHMSDGQVIMYENDGDYICAPSGGLTGGGDGKCPEDILNMLKKKKSVRSWEYNKQVEITKHEH